MKTQVSLLEKKQWTLKGDVDVYEVQVRGGYFTETRDKEEAISIVNEINEIENNLISLSNDQLETISEISSTSKMGCVYNSFDGDFHNVRMNFKRFATPLGIVEVLGGTIKADWTKGRGTPIYSDRKEFDETNNSAIAYKMNDAPDFTIWWKANTSMSVSESYINSNEIAILNKVIELLNN